MAEPPEPAQKARRIDPDCASAPVVAGGGVAHGTDRKADRTLRRQRSLEADATDCTRAAAPKHHRECWFWASRCLQALLHNDFQKDFMSELKAKLAGGVAMTTDYSGMGCMELAILHINTAMSRRGLLPECAPSMLVTRSGDVEPHCRRALMMLHGASESSTGLGVSHHVLGDATDRLPPGFKEKMKQWWQEADIESTGKTKDERKSLGLAFFQKCVVQLRSAFQCDKDGERGTQTYCFRCETRCPTFPTPAKPCKYRANAAGILCYDFSSMGTGKKLLGFDSTALLALWVCERFECQEDFIIAECVEHFQHLAFESDKTLMDMYHMEWLIISPCQIGLPAQRRRKFMIFLKKGKLRWHPDVAQDVKAAFLSIFGMQVDPSLTGSTYFHAPRNWFDEHKRKQARTRGLPPTRRNGRAWSSFQLLPMGLRQVLSEFERAASTPGGAIIERPICDLRQRPTYMPATRLAPALLRKSRLWSMEKRRDMLAAEALEVQGVGPIFERHHYDPAVDAAEDVGPASTEAPIADLRFFAAVRGDPGTEAFSDSQLRSLAGNGMSVAVAGSLLFFILSCTEEVA